jgi:hypothetical protein
MSDENQDAAVEQAIPLPAADFEKPGILARIVNIYGTPRRFFTTWLFPKYVEQSIAMRRGDCNRCGLCCQLVVKCVFLRYENGLAACGQYENRPPNCSKFPMNQADIDEVNRIAPHAPCGYSFAPPCKSRG